MTTWKTDRALIEDRFPSLLAVLDSLEPEAGESIKVQEAASGEPSLLYREKLIHSRHNPRREAQKLADLALADGGGCCVILGFALGYTAEAAHERDSGMPLVIVERHPYLLREAFLRRDLSALLKREKLAFLIEPSPATVLSVLEGFGGKPVLLSTRALRELDAAYYDSIEAAVRRHEEKASVNAATLRRFGKRWVRNLSANLDTIADVPGVSRLEGLCQGFPALIVAAGPSLDTILPHLPALSRRCLVIAVDTAVRAVLSTGVEPDFVVVVDPQFWNARHLDRAETPHSILITESATYPQVLHAPFRMTFLSSSLFPLGHFMEQRVDPKGALGAGGSVTTTALDFARLLGTGPIYIAGLDLSFPDFKTHFHGALFEERVHSESTRLSPLELRSVRALRDGSPFLAPATSGAPVLTDRRLSLYGSWFSAWMEKYPGLEVHLLSDRGLRIEGMDAVSRESLQALPPIRNEVEAVLSAAREAIEADFNSPRHRGERESRYRDAVETLEKELSRLASIAEKAEISAEKALEGIDLEKNMAELERAQREIEGSEAREIAGFLFPAPEELEEEQKSGDTGDKLRQYLDFARILYKKLGESVRYSAHLLAKNSKAPREASDTNTI